MPPADVPVPGPPTRVQRTVDWWFRDPSTGELVLGQAPNAAIGVWLVATAVRLVDVLPERERELGWIGSGALIVWGVDEVVRGATRFRRLLGAVVVVWQVTRFVR